MAGFSAEQTAGGAESILYKITPLIHVNFQIKLTAGVL